MDAIIKQSAGSIQCDFESIKSQLNSRLDEYRNAVFTEETKKDAKVVVADLRKQKKAFADRVKEVKAEYMRPWDEFNTKAQELIQLFDEPIVEINTQITAFEDKRIAEKKAHIHDLYLQVFGETPLLELDSIYNSKWENATTKDKAIIEELEAKKYKAEADIAVIKNYKSDAVEKAIDIYFDTLDLFKACNHINQYEEQKQEILERQKEAEIEKAKAEERAKVLAEQEQQKEMEQAVESAKAELLDSFIPVYDGVDAHEYTYVIYLTPSEKEALELYMNSIGIEYGELTF